MHQPKMPSAWRFFLAVLAAIMIAHLLDYLGGRALDTLVTTRPLKLASFRISAHG